MARDFTFYEGEIKNPLMWDRLLAEDEISFLVDNPEWPFTIYVDPLSSLISERLKDGFLGQW